MEKDYFGDVKHNYNSTYLDIWLQYQQFPINVDTYHAPDLKVIKLITKLLSKRTRSKYKQIHVPKNVFILNKYWIQWLYYFKYTKFQRNVTKIKHY